MRQLFLCLVTLSLAACATPARSPQPDLITLSVIGTNDVHGELLGRYGGLTAFSGYVTALRDARQSDGGVALLDAGDMWQGTLESNLGEGAAMIAAYNALAYDAAAIGNHEFDFGPAGEAFIPETPQDDPQGALKARAREAHFPLLAANVIDQATGDPVAWENVQPTTMFERAGVRIGVIGVTTAETIATTILANTAGLAIAPLAPTIEHYATQLRARDADLVIVVAHAGGRCESLTDPSDLSVCENDAEIFEVARALPRGLVDQIIAGHQHRGIAHEVNGIAITESFANARAFGRVDYRIDRATRKIVERTIFPAQRVCEFVDSQGQRCAKSDDSGAVAARYEGRGIKSLAAVADIVRAAASRADVVKREPLGITLETAITTNNQPFSAIGRLMTDAIREATGADVAIHNVVGGIRDSLPAGPLTFGDVYRAFPFDNRVAVIELTGASLRRLLTAQVQNTGRRAGISGLHVTVTCSDHSSSLTISRTDGYPVADADVLSVAANDFLLLGGDDIFTPIMPSEGFTLDHSQPRVRDLWVDWFRAHGGTLREADFLQPDQRRWYLPDPLPPTCTPGIAPE
ncbi:MAG: bifunctional UDP-sugar hydrolase/5'-nucleotidase [Gammaproteobacteria bacterium]